MSAHEDPFGDDPLVENRTFADLESAAFALVDKEFFRCTFRNCRWPKARIQRCAFEACTFDECDLSNLNPLSSSLRGVTFKKCKLLGAELGKLNDNPEVTFEDTSLRYAELTDLNLRAIQFRGCDLQNAQLTSCSLVDAVFSDCDLANATFSRCDLAGADLSTSRGVFIDPRQNSAKGAYVGVDVAVMLAQASGLLIAGYDDAPKKKRR